MMKNRQIILMDRQNPRAAPTPHSLAAIEIRGANFYLRHEVTQPHFSCGAREMTLCRGAAEQRLAAERP
ncbi:hypothetical protein, partial [Streptomyces thermospinosisporus]|uniref:hypothetical protein n=1 Tax=Streptomyces thermospinosisporus TaxID=161482 RepID=UPI0031D19F00